MITISSINPTCGPSSTLVTIKGTGFSAQDSVFFNGKNAGIVSASATQLIVKVPPQAGTGKTFITASGESATGPVFTFTGNTYLVSTFAGSGDRGFADGIGTAAAFKMPYSLAIDRHDNLYVADIEDNRIRKITPAGAVTTFAGNGFWRPEDGTGVAAGFSAPGGITVDGNDNVYVADGDKIRKITPDGAVSTFAGSSSDGSADGIGTAATFYCPVDVAADGSGNVFVSDFGNRKIRKINPSGVVSTFAGNGAKGSADGTAATASFNHLSGINIDAADNLYVADTANNNIRKITDDGIVTTMAGGYLYGIDLSPAPYTESCSVAVDGNGFMYVADLNNHVIRQLTPEGVVTLLAGTPGSMGTDDGPALTAKFNSPGGIAIDSRGNIFVADRDNCLIRKLTPQ